MKLVGLNANEEFDENNIDIHTLIKNLKRSLKLKKYSYDLSKYYEMIEQLYNSTFASLPKQTKSPIFTKGTLFHFSPMKDNTTGEIFYDKLESIAKNGLLPVSMLVANPDATDPTFVSFHSVLNNEKTLKDISKRKKAGKTDLTFFIDTFNPTIQRLMKLGLQNGQNINSLKFEQLLKQNNEDEIIKRMFIIDNIYMPDNLTQKGVCYLPIGVPADYISAIVVPDEFLQDEKFMQILSDNFVNAVILDKNQKEVERISKNINP